MNLKQLTHLVAVAETLNFHKAAERVFLTQSALSRSIASLEQELNVRVFDRVNGKVSISHAGRQVLARARSLVGECDRFVDEMQQLQAGTAGVVHFGLGPFLAASVTPAVLCEFHNANPAVQLRVSINRWDYLYKQLMEGELEFFVVDAREISVDDELSILLLGSPSIGFYCRRGHPLCGAGEGRPLAGKAVCNYPIASVAIPPVVKQELRHALKLDSEFHVDIESDDLLLLANLLPGTDLVLLSAQQTLDASVLAANIVQLDVMIEDNHFGTWGLVRKANRQLSPAAQALADALSQHVERATGGAVRGR